MAPIVIAAAIAAFGFIFWSATHPDVIKMRAPYLMGVGFAMLALLMDSIAMLATYGGGGERVLDFIAALLLIVAVLMLFIGAGGASMNEMAGQFEDVLGGLRAPKKTPIVPITGEMPKQRAEPAPPPPSIPLD